MFSVSAQSDGRYVLMVASGPASVAELCAATSFLSEMLRRSGNSRALMDMMGMDFVLDEAGDRAVLQHLKATLPVLERLAVVVPARSSHGLLAAAARTHGTQVAEFDNLPDADRWLTG